jgi:hypothetical protein
VKCDIRADQTLLLLGEKMLPDEIIEYYEVLFDEYALCDDSKLSKDAIELKDKLLISVMIMYSKIK